VGLEGSYTAISARLSFLPDPPKTLHDFLDAVRKADALLRSLEPTYFQKKSIATPFLIIRPTTDVTPTLTSTPPATDDPMDCLSPNCRRQTSKSETTTQQPLNGKP